MRKIAKQIFKLKIILVKTLNSFDFPNKLASDIITLVVKQLANHERDLAKVDSESESLRTASLYNVNIIT